MADERQLSLEAAWQAWGPRELVDEMTRVGPPGIAFIGGPPDPRDDRARELRSLRDEWLRTECAAGRLCIDGVDLDDGFSASRQPVAASVAPALHPEWTANAITLGSRRLVDIQVFRPSALATARPSASATPKLPRRGPRPKKRTEATARMVSDYESAEALRDEKQDTLKVKYAVSRETAEHARQDALRYLSETSTNSDKTPEIDK